MSEEPRARWRYFADRLKHNPRALRVADAMGRGKGRLRLLDRFVRVPAAPLRPDLSDWNERKVSAVWLGHASVLFRLGGRTILADPVFSPRVGVGMCVMTVGPARLVGLPVELRDLPTPDVVLVSHAHFDHLDRPTLQRLPKSAEIVTSEHNSDLVRDFGYRAAHELRWGDSRDVGGVRVTAVPVKHWGARVFHDAHRGACGFLLEHGGTRVLFGADSAYFEGWRGLGPVDLCCVGIGAYDPWVANHATPEQAARMADHCQARLVLPMHHSTFKLSHEPLADPLKRFRAVVPPERIALTQIGGEWTPV